MPTVDIEGIGPIDFPEGVTREQAADIIRKAIAAKTPRQSLSIPQQAGAVMAGIGRGLARIPVDVVEGFGGITGSDTLIDLARGMRESDIGRTFLETPDNYKDRTASTVGEVVGNIGGMFLPGGVLKAPKAIMAANAVLSGLQGASEQVQRADENRRAGMEVSSGDQQIASLLGVLPGALDMIPYARMAGTIAPKGLKLAEAAAGRSVIGRALGTGAIESATEAGQQGLQNIIERGYNANQDLAEGLMDNATAGGAAGFGMDAILGMMAKGTGKRVMQRRAALDSVPLDALPNANSIGIRNVGGNPFVEYLARMEAAATKPMPEMPHENYRKPVVEAEAPTLTAKEKKAAEALRIQQRMQQTMPEIGAIDVNLDDIAAEQQAALDAQAASPQEPITPLYSKDAAYPDVRLTEEGTIEEPSRLAMDQPGAPRFSVDTQPAAPTQYTVDNLRQEIEAGTKPQIALDIYNEMEALGGEGLFSTRLVDSLNNGKSEGTYANRVIELALESKSKEDLLRTLNHEAVHGMKQMGLFNDTEWSILNAAFNPDTSLTDYEREQYAKLYNGDQTKINEEAIARGIERYAAGQIDAPVAAVSVAAKAAGTVERLGNVLRGKGFQNATDVMQSFRSGEMATRDANLPSISKPRTMRDYEKGLYDTPIPNGKTNRPVVQPAKNVGPVKDGKRTTSLADLIDQDQTTEDTGEVRHSYAGENAYAGTLDADLMTANKKTAEEMEKAGKPADNIRLATGWFRSPYDKKWRTEVADDTAKLTPAFAAMPESKLFSKEDSLPLAQVLDHPELFKAYPELKGVKVVKRAGFLDFSGGLQGSFNPESNTLTITPYAKDPGSTILHEMQHWIQSKEGFATGGNEDMAVKALSPKKIEKLAREALKKKEAELDKASTLVDERLSALQESAKYKGEIEELNRLSDDALSAYRVWKKTDSDVDKKAWLALQDRSDGFKNQLAKRISGSSSDGESPTIDELMRVHSLKSASQSGLDSARKSLVKLQQEIADIRSGDPKALERAIKQSGAAYDAYKNIAGEIEARDVQARQKYTPDERKAKRPMESENINPDDVITVGGGTSDTRYSIVPQLPVSGKTPFGAPDERTQLKKAIDTFVAKDGLGGIALKTRQNFLDMRAGIAEASRRASKSRGESSDMAATSAEAAVRAYDVAQDQAASALKNGALEWVPGKNGGGYFRSNGDVANAPATVFKEAYEKGKLSQLFHYLAAERADVLRSEGRENKISAADAAAWKDYGDDPDIANYAKRWKTFNDQMVDTLQKSGRIDAETAKKFKANTYLPFYRIEEGVDGSVNFQSSGATLASSPRLEKLKGSELDIGDPTDNIVRNVNTLTSMAMKNEAMQRVVRDGMQLKFIKQVPKSESGKMNVKVWVDGKEKHFEVSDPILFASMQASRIPSSTALTLAGWPSNFLRSMVTLDPVFMINNPVRDSTMAWLQGYTDFPLQQLAQSAYKAIANKPSFQRLERAGVIGNSIRGEGGAAGTGKTLRESYTGKTSPMHRIQEFSRKSEGITRNTVYESVMKRTGGDEAQAQYEARELLNFNRRGADPTVQLVNALIPFQNASWQGLDVFYRTLRGKGANPEMRKQMLARMGVLAGLSAAYTIMASQTPEWQEASEEERDANWFLPGGLKMKIPFEAGFVAKVIPERVTALFMKHDTGREFLSAMSRFFWSTMKVDAIPQAMKPAWEVKTNHSSFRDKPIEPEYMRSKEKTQRFDDNTSELAKKISEYTEVLSPLQVDHLLRGYTGAIGTYGIQAMSLLANPEKAKAAMSMAERTPSDLPVLGRFFQREEGGKSLGQYYELSDRAEQAQSALKAGLEPTDERVKLAAIDRAVKPIDRQMKTLTDAEKKVRSLMATGGMSPEEARPMLREYRKMKTELAKMAVKMERE